MARFNKASTATGRVVKNPLNATSNETSTHEGGIGYRRDAKAELFLLAVSFMGGDSNFYENTGKRYERLKDLVWHTAASDHEWLIEMIRWVRNSAQMRTVAGVMAVEAVMARLEYAKAMGEKTATSQGPVNRRLIDAACARADEPAEILAYYLSKYPKPIPLPIEKGLGDAVRRLYTERGFLRYGATNNKAVTMQDVLRLTHVKTDDAKQNALFNYIVGKGEIVGPESLPKIHARNELMAMPQESRREFMMSMGGALTLKVAEMGWENISSWLGKMDKEAWEAVIPNMGVMALLRNLRNFDQVGITDQFANEHIIPKLMAMNEIHKSRVLPMRFYSAYKHAPSLRWPYPLEVGLNYTVGNIPELPGRTLVLIDMSQSMNWGTISDRSKLTYAEAAKIFGAVLKSRNPGADLVQYGSTHEYMRVRAGESVLKVIGRFKDLGGTRTEQTLRETYDGHDRVIIVTDEQAHYSPYAIGEGINAPIYTWNLAGYEAAHAHGTNRHTFGGGFSDAAFGMITLLEQGQHGTWPWETN